MDYQSMRLEDRQGRQRVQDCLCYPKKIYLRVIVPAPKEHLKYSGVQMSGVSPSAPRSYTMVAKEMSFEIGKIIRCDTYGEIRLAHSSTSSKTIVVKCIRKDHPQMQSYVRYILPREIALLKMLKGHPNVVSFIGVLDADHYAMVAMEHVEGMSLLDFIHMKHYVREDEARIVLKELLNTVITCHSLGISIRGLSCENVLLDKSFTPKISTFEHAIVRGYDKVDIFKGTSYSPPEVFEGREYDSKAVDVWSLGVILYTMVTGTPPPSVTSLDQTKKNSLIFPSYLSSQCRKTIEKMLQPYPMRRSTTLELRQDEWLNSQSVRSLEYHDTETDEDFTCPSLSSADIRYGHQKKMPRYHPSTEHDLCRNCFNMKNAARMESVELMSEESFQQRRNQQRRAPMDRESFVSRREKYRMPPNYTLIKNNGKTLNIQVSRSLSTGTLVSARSEVQLEKLELPSSMLRSSKSMESVSTTVNCRQMENNSRKETAGYSDVECFLAEEKKQLADTNKVLAEERRFLEFFDMYLPPGGKVCANSTASGASKVPKPHLLDKSTSYQCDRVDQSTSCNITINKPVCSVGINAVVRTANQSIQSVSLEMAGSSCNQQKPEMINVLQRLEESALWSDLKEINLTNDDNIPQIMQSSSSLLIPKDLQAITRIGETSSITQESETDITPSIGDHSLDKTLPDLEEINSSSATEIMATSEPTVTSERKKTVLGKFFSFLKPKKSLEANKQNKSKKLSKSVIKHQPVVISMESKVSPVSPIPCSETNRNNPHSVKNKRLSKSNGTKSSNFSVGVINPTINRPTETSTAGTKNLYDCKPVEQ